MESVFCGSFFLTKTTDLQSLLVLGFVPQPNLRDWMGMGKKIRSVEKIHGRINREMVVCEKRLLALGSFGELMGRRRQC